MAETVGEQLKQAREARKLSLEQVYQATRINMRYLKGLEDNQRSALPSPVQAKGFLRLYADFLCLPVQPLLDTWDGKLPPSPPPSTEPVSTETDPAQATDLKLLTAEPPEQSDAEPATGPLDEGVDEAEDEAAENAAEIEELPAEEEAIVPIEADFEEEEPPLAEPEILKQSETIFKEIGAQMRERRESLGLTMSDVEHYTKLRKHYLTAMEDGRLNDLPSLVQGRGMLSNYARFLEMDAEALLLRFAEALQQRRIEKLPPEPKRPLISTGKRKPATTATKTPIRRLVTPDIMIGGIIVLVIIAIVVWTAAQVSALRGQANEPTAPPIANVLISSPTPVPKHTLPPEEPAAVNQPASNAGAGNANTGETTPTAVPVMGDAPLQVYVIANDRAWMQVSEDGKVKFNGRVVPGNAYPFSGKDKIELVTGNAAALQVFFNQQDLGSLGINSQVVRLVFTSKGIMTPTPSFSATPTVTQAPSMTPKPSPTHATPTVTPFIP